MTVLDTIQRAARELEELSEDLDLDPRQTVCGVCNLVYWKPVGFCTNCRSHD